MDATRPNDAANEAGGRFYIICETSQTFRAIPAGHGSGRNLEGAVDFQNGRLCARNFGNAMESNLTAGGAYVTSTITTSFKGYYRAATGEDSAFLRTFIQFDGEGETANARRRAIGGHAAATLKSVCLRKEAGSPYATTATATLRSDNSWITRAGEATVALAGLPSDAQQILSMVKNDPTTLYIYPESADINAVEKAVATGLSPSQAGLYWNASCLQEIRAPKFWARETLEPIIERYTKDHPAPPLDADADLHCAVNIIELQGEYSIRTERDEPDGPLVSCAHDAKHTNIGPRTISRF